MRRVIARVAVVAAAASAVACDRPSSSPTTSTRVSSAAPGPITLSAFTEGAVAIQDISTVTFQAPFMSAASRYAIDFGDGQSARMLPPIGRTDVAAAYHEYFLSGVFTAYLSLSDGQGGATVVASATVIVRSIDGRWSSSVFNTATRRQETRTFQLSQSGSGLSGSYVDADGTSRAIRGSLSSPRSIRMAADGQTIASGTDLDGDGIDSDVSAFTVRFTGGSAIGQRLTFVRH